jgi:hypothetical protein
LRHYHSKLLEISRYLGDGSNQTAELHAMRESFILARPRDTIFSDPRYAVSDSRYAVSDSRYAVMLITADWHPKAHRDLISEIKKNFIRVGFSTSGLLDTSGTLAGAR